MNVCQRAWASLLKRIEAKTSWGRNELKQQMLEAMVEAMVEAGGCLLCEQDKLSAHINHVDKEQAMENRYFRVPTEVDYSASALYVDADAIQRKAQQDG